jgi:hypothetical protein
MSSKHFAFASAILVLAVLLNAHSQEPKKTSTKTSPAKNTSLRQPGFVFLELNTATVKDHVEFFKTVADFKEVDVSEKWAWLQSERGDLMFNGSGGTPNKGYPPGTRRVPGVEVGVVVADLDKTFAAVAAFSNKGFNVVDKIARRPWGPRDFRLLTPEGYYIRFTEPM